MIRNDFLLRVLLLFGFFWLFKLFFESISLIYGWFRWQTNWLAIIGGAILAVIVAMRVESAIRESVAKKKEMSTTIRWLLYILLGYAFYISSIKLVERYFYDRWGFWKTFNDTDFWARPKGFAVLIGSFILSWIITRYLVRQLFYKRELDNLIPVLPDENKQTSLAQQQVAPTVRGKNDKITLHGSAAFSNLNEFNQRYSNLSNDQMYDSLNETGGYVILPNTIKYIPHTHVVTVAGAGQGKGTTTIIPNLLTKPNESWIVLDVKGENAAVTANFRRASSEKIFIVDPFAVQDHIGARHGLKASGFNPLLVAKYLPSEEISDFASMMAEMFVPEDKKQSGSDSFFSDSARNLIKGYILYIITAEDVKEKHLGKLYEWLRLSQEEEVSLWVDMGYNDHTKFIVNEFKSLAVSAPQTWGGVISNARRATAFLDSPLIQKSLSNEGFDPMTLQTHITTAYIILPERNLNTHKTWLRIVFGTVLKLCNFVAKRRVNFIMDEFPILGRMDDFLRAYAFGRGQKISCWIFAQSLSQLKDIYGEDGLNTFLSNARLRQFFGINDYYTQQYVSNLLGTTTEIVKSVNSNTNTGSSSGSSHTAMSWSTSTNTGFSSGSSTGVTEQIVKRPLMTPEEVGKLKDDFLLLVDGEKYLVEKVPYYRPGIYDTMFDPNPYV